MSPAFLRDVKLTGIAPLENRIYKCQHCYRPDLKADFVAFVSHGEAYCKSCAQGE